VSIIAEFADQLAPLGPFGDPDERLQSEHDWLAGLTTEDALSLISWIQSGTALPGWTYTEADTLARQQLRAATIAGTVGRPTHDPRIRSALESLLTAETTFQSGFEGLVNLADPETLPLFAKYSSTNDPVLAYQIIEGLGEMEGADARELLQRLRTKWADNEILKETAETALEKCQA
jgi:hypothetical protein